MFPPDLNRRIQALVNQAPADWRAQPALFLAVVSSLDVSLFDRTFSRRRAGVYITPEFLERFELAMQTGDYVHHLEKELRAMMVVNASGVVQDAPIEVETEESGSLKLKRMQEAFHKTPYRGDYARQLRTYLSQCSRRFSAKSEAVNMFATGKGYFGKFISVTQTSGCGKSRMLLELGRTGLFLLYINLHGRNAREDTYPPRDNIPAEILVDGAEATEAEYLSRARAFFGAIFCAMKDWLSECTDRRQAIHLWEQSMLLEENNVRNRKAFFENVSRYFEPLHVATNEIDALLEPLSSLVTAFSQIFKGEEPVFVIALDQADCLKSRTYQYQLSDVLCKVISAYSCRFHQIPIWVVFSSALPTVGDYAEMAFESTSRVIQAGENIFPPFSEFGWDHYAPAADTEGPLDSDRLATADHLCRFGRPIWGALLERTTVTALEVLAEDWLCGSRTFDPWNEPDRVLAVLSQRFALDVLPGHPYSLAALDNGIVSHMRYLHRVSGDRRWRETSYPSEPFLSHVAGGLLGLRCNDTGPEQRQIGGISYTVKLVPALRMLATMMREGIVDKYKDGDLISRVLLLSCRDLIIRDTYLPPARKNLGTRKMRGGPFVSSMDVDSGVQDFIPTPAPQKPYDKETQLAYCREVPLLKLLACLFGQRVWPNDTTERDALARDFYDAQVNFSHWVKVTENRARKKGCDDPVSADEWNRRLYLRTSAVQFSTPQGGISQLFPIYFERRNAFSNALVSVCLCELGVGSSAADAIDPLNPQLALERLLPHVAIAFDFSTNDASAFSSRYEQGCLRIYAPGMDTAAFPFMERWPNMETALQMLGEEAMRDEWRGPAKWGASTSHEDLLWGEERS
ncbi:hypothetical protein F5148DRAFT_1280271 [Russula earlei]|uniref:Uncharacterized protein n=1 Tax=Russula earlei TaxID=71964 RepID=A0ACC0UJH7_9AGAM|nr:hypothetical protein F5148DRAFT_1280271 [Russula earlei]